MLGISTGGPEEGWNPSAISSCIAWFHADALEYEDGDAVEAWADSHGDYDLTAASGHQPEFKTGIINDEPVCRWGAAAQEDLMTHQLSALAAHSTGTVIVVATVGSGISLYSAFVGSADQATHNYIFCLGTIDSGEAGGAGGTQLPWVFVYSSGSVNQSFCTADILETDVPHIFTYESDDSVYNIRLDGVDKARVQLQDAEDGSWTANILNRDNLAIGGVLDSFATGTYHHTGDIAEVAIFSEKLSSSDRSLVEQYLSSKYDIDLGA